MMRLKSIGESIDGPKAEILKILKDAGLKHAAKISGPHIGRVFTTYSKGYEMDKLDSKNLKFHGLSREEFDNLVQIFQSNGFEVESRGEWRPGARYQQHIRWSISNKKK